MSTRLHDGPSADKGDDAFIKAQVERIMSMLSGWPATSWLGSAPGSRDTSGLDSFGTAGEASAPNASTDDRWRGLLESPVEYGQPGKGIDPRLAKALLAALDDPSRWAAERYRAPPNRESAED